MNRGLRATALFASKRSVFACLGLAAAILFLPVVGSSYQLDVANRIGIAMIGALGLNILTGYTGLISLGNAAFMAIGAFSAGYLTAGLGFNGLLAIPMAGLITAALGMVVGIPSLRLKGFYLALATLAAHFIVEFTVVKWEPITGGVNGLSVPAPGVGGYSLDSDRSLLYLIFFWVAAATLFAANLFRTRTGRAFIAIRDHEAAAGVMGINVFRYKLLAFGISSFYVGVAGALAAFHARLISPETFPITLAIDFLAMIIIGGLGTVSGSLLGAAALTLLPELLRVGATSLSGSYPLLLAKLAALKELVFGLLIIIFLIREPHGLAARWKSMFGRESKHR